MLSVWTNSIEIFCVCWLCAAEEQLGLRIEIHLFCTLSHPPNPAHYSQNGRKRIVACLMLNTYWQAGRFTAPCILEEPRGASFPAMDDKQIWLWKYCHFVAYRNKQNEILYSNSKKGILKETFVLSQVSKKSLFEAPPSDASRSQTSFYSRFDEFFSTMLKARQKKRHQTIRQQKRTAGAMVVKRRNGNVIISCFTLHRCRFRGRRPNEIID